MIMPFSSVYTLSVNQFRGTDINRTGGQNITIYGFAQVATINFLDLSKAFDTLDHSSLSNKSKFYGISNTPLKCFQSYLQSNS